MSSHSETPQDWKTKLLDEVCEVAIGGTPSRNEPRFWDTDNTTGYPWVTISDLGPKWITKTQERITDLGVINSNVKLVSKGTPLMSFKLTIGRTGIAGMDLYTNEAIAAFVPRSSEIWLPWLYHTLPEVAKGGRADQAIKGKTLNKDKIQQLTILLPSCNEQRNIAKILDIIDTRIQENEKLISKLKFQREGLLHDLFTLGIDQQGRLRDLLSHPEQFKDSRLGHIPREWEVGILRDICQKITDGCHQSVKTSDDGIPFLYVSCIKDGPLSLHFLE